MALDAVEFTRRFLLHVLPSGLVRIRQFGVLSNRVRQQKLDQCRVLLAALGHRPSRQEQPSALPRSCSASAWPTTWHPLSRTSRRPTQLLTARRMNILTKRKRAHVRVGGDSTLVQRLSKLPRSSRGTVGALV
jgi:hypothetical protein